jgi:hypothetical protein
MRVVNIDESKMNYTNNGTKNNKMGTNESNRENEMKEAGHEDARLKDNKHQSMIEVDDNNEQPVNEVARVFTKIYDGDTHTGGIDSNDSFTRYSNNNLRMMHLLGLEEVEDTHKVNEENTKMWRCCLGAATTTNEPVRKSCLSRSSILICCSRIPSKMVWSMQYEQEYIFF